MDLVAHRGFAAEAPENTIPALVRAAAIADGVEFDVRASADGEPVVVHDATIDRVTGGTGRVADRDAAALAGLSVEGTDAGIPTLAATLDALGPDTPLLVELKETDVAPAVVDALADYGGPATVASFDDAALRAARAAAPSVPRAVVAGSPVPAPVSRAIALDCETVMLRARLLAVPSIRQALRHVDLRCYAWTIERRATAAALGRLGVDGVIADRSDVLPARR